MRANYLWNDELQDEDELTSSYFLNSVAFLSKVRNSDDYVSYIDTTCSQPIIGHGYQLAIAQVNDTALMAVITYIEPTSEVISEINDLVDKRITLSANNDINTIKRIEEKIDSMIRSIYSATYHKQHN